MHRKFSMVLKERIARQEKAVEWLRLKLVEEESYLRGLQDSLAMVDTHATPVPAELIDD